MSVNRRKYPRVSIRVPVNYTLLDIHGETESELIGVALDVSLGGLLLESLNFVGNEYVGIEFIDIDNRGTRIKCKMAYSRKTDMGTVHTGLSFQGQETEKLDFVTKIIRANFYREKLSLHNDKAPTACTDYVNEQRDLIYLFGEKTSS
jgi:hypothetical protein